MQNATSFSLYRHVETQLWILLDQTGCRKWWNNAVSLKVWKILSRLNFRRTNVIHGNEQKVNRFCSTENAILSPQMFKFWNKTISVESNYLKEIYIHFKQLTVCYISCAQKTVVVFFSALRTKLCMLLTTSNFTNKSCFNVARTYLYTCWLCFWFAFFRMKDSTDLYDFWHP